MTHAHRYVFVTGLHRTGTSLLARMIASHPAVSGINHAPVPENEGCYLQGAIPHTARDGVPGEFATDPLQRMDETHPLNSWATKQRYDTELGRWFDPGGLWRIEKSPVNLTKMRLLQGLFPLSQFVVIVRHPSFMAAAVGKWSDKSYTDLTSYGNSAYRMLLDDLTYLHSAFVLRYEDLVAQPSLYAKAITSFLDLEPGMRPEPMRNGNADYPDVGLNCASLHEFGYSAYGAIEPWVPIVQHPLRKVRESVRTILAG
ncbi:sulfotransferase family protein [Erythrobacter sp. R86502]|uniref:sulfotransferase family protein n=1 Tax=Erythrobacter sp. R86502 TaxID=3093846 RepID=UPI0036D2DF39